MFFNFLVNRQNGWVCNYVKLISWSRIRRVLISLFCAHSLLCFTFFMYHVLREKLSKHFNIYRYYIANNSWIYAGKYETTRFHCMSDVSTVDSCWQSDLKTFQFVDNRHFTMNWTQTYKSDYLLWNTFQFRFKQTRKVKTF